MLFSQKQKYRKLLQAIAELKTKQMLSPTLYCTIPAIKSSADFQELCGVVSCCVGGLDELEASLDKFHIPFTSSLVTQVLDSCKDNAPTRRLLRFFLWSRKTLDRKLENKDYNHALRVFAEKKDFTAMDIVISDLGKEGFEMEASTFSIVAESMVKLGHEEEALGIFKNLHKFKCPQDRATVSAIIRALCFKGHAKKAEGVLWHHKDKISGVEPCIYRSLLYGWSEQENVKEARRIIKEMKSLGIMPDLFCYNTFLRCLCEQNLKSNPSGLVPEALNVLIEMRSHRITPTSVSYNILLSCLGRTRRVTESVGILKKMKTSGCCPDWITYYLVARVLFLTGRFGKGKQVIDEMLKDGLVPAWKFYHDLIGVLCGVERVNYALELFEEMKRTSVGGYGPVYDLLIQKLCRGGEFEKGRELWDEAMAMGIGLGCSSDVLDPSVTEVFKPVRKVEEAVNLVDEKPKRQPRPAKKSRRRRKITRKDLRKIISRRKKAKVTSRG